jgi:ActR/RegA family two-component response regulator
VKPMLIIDDDDLFIEMLRKTLGLHDVRVAHTMKDALRMIDEAAPERIILDLSLPDSTFEETLARIHELKTRSKDATVIVITGRPDVDQLQASAINAGAKVLLSKDKGFFNSLSEALVSSGWKAPCASQSIVEKIEQTVDKIVGSPPTA